MFVQTPSPTSAQREALRAVLLQTDRLLGARPLGSRATQRVGGHSCSGGDRELMLPKRAGRDSTAAPLPRAGLLGCFCLYPRTGSGFPLKTAGFREHHSRSLPSTRERGLKQMVKGHHSPNQKKSCSFFARYTLSPLVPTYSRKTTPQFNRRPQKPRSQSQADTALPVWAPSLLPGTAVSPCPNARKGAPGSALPAHFSGPLGDPGQHSPVI